MRYKNDSLKFNTKLEKFLESRFLHLIVLGFILINALVIGLETSAKMESYFGRVLDLIEYTILGLFVVEICVRLIVLRGRFFRKGWNIFDFIVISISLLPHASGLSILRVFRVIHSLSLFELSPQMRHIIQALRHVGLSAINVSLLMIVAFYVLGVVGVELFSEHFPMRFGTLPVSFLTLFQLMVYDEYGLIARPILEAYPFAWVYFLMVTVILAFVLINFFVAVVVTALQRAVDTDPLEGKVKQQMKMLVHDEKTIQDLKAEIQELKKMIRALKK